MEQDFYTNVTLAYSRNHKTSKRTSFQDELKAVVNKRAVKNKVSCLNSNYFNDDDDDGGDDDVLNELLKTRRKKMDMFKSSGKKSSLYNFQLSDDEEENIRPKRVSFLKSQRNFDTFQSDHLQSEPLQSEPLQSDPPQPAPSQPDPPQSDTSQSDAFRSDRSLILHPVKTKVLSQDKCQLDSDFPTYSEASSLRNSSSESSACRSIQLQSPLLLDSENSQWESSYERLLVATPPTPAPRQLHPHLASNAGDERDGQTSNRAAPSEIHTPSNSSSPTPTSTPSFSQTKKNSVSDSAQDCVSLIVNEHSGPLEGVDSTAEQKRQQNSQLTSDVSPLTDCGGTRSSASRPGSSRMSRSAPSQSAESRYLGTLKVLEQKQCFQETGLDTADSLRASVYQDWLMKKQEKIQATLKAKKLEEKLKEEKKLKEETSKKAEAETSFEAWKKKKHEVLTEKVKEKQEERKKLQKYMEDKEEKKETAKRIFEKWKEEHDLVLRKKLQKQLQIENKLKEEKEKEKVQRMRESSLSVTQWNVRKKELMKKKLESLRKINEIKEMEETYEKEEKERTALEMYDDWLRKKEYQQKRERRQKNMKVTMQEEPPPPWSPPNKTVPFRK